ncbi:MAG: hypothetical protein J6N72_01805, partial [Psychrobacter sp.]|nr:hypothetical protein [Psychrobacter sp.]
MKSKYSKNTKLVFIGIGIALVSNITYAQNTEYVGFNNPVKGIEYGVEHQLETVKGDRFVERVFARVQRTYDWEIYKDEKGSTFDVEVKGGAIFGRYKGATDDGDYGSKVDFRTGLRAEAQGTYTYNMDKVDPFVGLSTDVEVIRAPRIEWQADAVAGVKFNIDEDKDLSVAYSKTLAHGFNYYKEDKKYRQDKGHAIALIGTKRNNKTSQS